MPDKQELGKRIKKVREHRHLTLKNIEATAGISATHISEIERGKTSPTLGALIRIAGALGKDPAYFVEEDDLADTSLVRRENRTQERLAAGAGTLERLSTSIPGGRLQGRLVRLEAGRDDGWHVPAHAGQEAVLVLAGRIVFRAGDERHELGEGDSVVSSVADIHHYANASGEEKAALVWVCTDRSAGN